MITKILGNKKISLGLITVALIFAIIVVSSFFPFVIDPSKVLTKEFLTDELIITAIVLAVTVSMMFIAEASNSMNPNSEIAKAKVEFKASLNKITNHTHLYQWIKKVLQIRDKKEIAEREMSKLLLPYELFELNENDLLKLINPQEINGKIYGPYPLKKLKKVIQLKKTIAKIRFVSPNYYTSVKSIQTDMTLSEIARNENSKKIATIVIKLSTRIILVWTFASIFGSLVRDLTQDGGNTAQAWMRFLSRMVAFGSSCFLGYQTGCQLNDLDAFYILKRIETHVLFLEDKEFVYVDERLDILRSELYDKGKESIYT